MSTEVAIAEPTFVRTLRLRVKSEAYPWLNAAAIEVNEVWNFSNAVSARAARPFAAPAKWLSAYDLDKLTAGAAAYFEHIGSDTIQRVNAELARRRKQFKKTRLRWRVSRGARRSLGWIPFKAVQLKRRGKSLRFSGKSIRVFERALLEGKVWKSGCFAQDSVGDWWLCLPVEHLGAHTIAPKEAVGLDLGLKDTVATSDGDKLQAGHFYRHFVHQIAQAQRRATSVRLNACTAAPPDGAKTPCTSFHGRSSIRIAPFSSAMCEQPEVGKNTDGQIGVGCWLGHAQGAATVQGLARR